LSQWLELGRAASKAARVCARIVPGEAVLVLADTAAEEAVVRAFAIAAASEGGKVHVLVSETQPEINREPAAAVAAAMKLSDVVLDLTSQYFIHTDAYQAARDHGTRILCASGVTVEMLVRLVDRVDYVSMAALGQRVTDVFGRGACCRVESGNGHVLTMALGGRPALLRDGMLEGAGDLDYLPGAQMSLAPVEETIEGSIQVDLTAYPPVPKLSGPFVAEFRAGRVVSATGCAQGNDWMAWLGRFGDDQLFQVAHISVGFNPMARPSGRILEDERVPGCFVIGFGSQMRHLGGRLGKAASHSDLVVTGATVRVDQNVVCRGGRFEQNAGG
jgi:leucyl aminopeptidase (aminopeptidase T)